MTDEPTTIRVLIADNDGDVRQEIRSILDQSNDVEVVGEATAGNELDPLLRTARADILIVDMALQQSKNFKPSRPPSSNGHHTRVLVMTQRNDSRYVARAIHAGAAGFLLKDRAFEELDEAIRRIASGGVFISAGIAGIEREV